IDPRLDEHAELGMSRISNTLPSTALGRCCQQSGAEPSRNAFAARLNEPGAKFSDSRFRPAKIAPKPPRQVHEGSSQIDLGTWWVTPQSVVRTRWSALQGVRGGFGLRPR